MCLIYINLVVAAVTAAMMILTDIVFRTRFARRYPDIKLAPRTGMEIALWILRTVVASLIPLFNLDRLKALVLESSVLEEKYMRETHEKCMKEAHAGSNTCVCCGCDIPEGRQVCPSCVKIGFEREVEKK